MNLEQLFDYYEFAKEGYKINPKNKLPSFVNETHKELEELVKVNNFLKEKLTQKDNNGTLCTLEENGKYFLCVAFISYNAYNERILNVLPIEVTKEKFDMLNDWIKK
jgi:hypothetical protein